MGPMVNSSKLKKLTKIFSDESLTKKASLNAMASILDYAARLVLGFVITPITVNYLGDYVYGAWKILNSSIGFISPTSGRPSTVLRYTLAHHQMTADYNQKRVYIGSALVAWLVFLPLVAIVGGIFSWFIPQWIGTSAEYVWQIRITAAILVGDLALTGIGAIPQAVMQGQNLGYKRIGLSVLMVFLGGGLTWLSLAMGYGIIGVAVAAIVATTLSGLFYLAIAKSYTPWLGINRPSKKDLKNYIGLSWWFILWDVVFKATMSIDVIILGLLHSVESVTYYTLTKYAPEMLITIIAIVVFGVAPGLGGIIGSKDFEKAARVRGEIFVITWLIITSLGTTTMLWNRGFLTLWVGLHQYAGSLPMLLILIVVSQFVLIRIDANFIDLTLKIQQKVLLGAISLILTILVSVLLVKVFDLGIIGILIGMVTGRFVLSIGYPAIVGRVLGITIVSQILKILRPLLFTSVFLIGAYLLDSIEWVTLSSGLLGWITFFLAGVSTFILLFFLGFFVGLNRSQRARLILRGRQLIHIAPEN